MKVCLGTTEVCGTLLKLKKGFDELGINNMVFNFSLHPFEYGGINEYGNIKMDRYFRLEKEKLDAIKSNNKYRILYSKIKLTIERLRLFIYAMRECDAFFYIYGAGFFYGNTILRLFERIEFILLKMFNKKVVVEYNGSDSRPPYCDGAFHQDITELYKETKEKSRRVRMVEKYALAIDNPASSHFHDKAFVSVFSIWNPVDIVNIDNSKLDKTFSDIKKHVKILHAPSDFEAKGTNYIREIIQQLSKMYSIEYVELNGVRHEEVIKHLKEADLVVDQVYSDTPLAMFATEACCYGVPVIVSGYFAPYMRESYSHFMPPTCFCHPDELKDKIEYYICHKEERERLGFNELTFVSQNNSNAVVSRRIFKLFYGDVDKECWVNPMDTDYIMGWGIKRESVRERVKYLYEKFGEKGFQLGNKKGLIIRYINLIHGETFE